MNHLWVICLLLSTGYGWYALRRCALVGGAIRVVTHTSNLIVWVFLDTTLEGGGRCEASRGWAAVFLLFRRAWGVWRGFSFYFNDMPASYRSELLPLA